jgi:molybdenum cofactor synthesis domain-containing protein
MGGNDDVHPMVPVPEAIRTVIRETGRVLLERQEQKGKTNALTLSSDAPWSELLGKVLDQDVRMNEPGYPPYRASIMDGYAIRTTEFRERSSCSDQTKNDNDNDNTNEWTHSVVDKVYAGDTVPNAPPPATSMATAAAAADAVVGLLPSAYYITTGAVVPDTYDCVVPVEDCVVAEDQQWIRIASSTSTSTSGRTSTSTSTSIQPNQWIRPIGCDLAAGSVVLPRGHVMDPVALGLLKQSGAEQIHVKRPVVVGVLSTGNELILGSSSSSMASSSTSTSTSSSPGKIPDVNRPILLNLLASFGSSYCETVDLGMVRDDDVAAMTQTMDKALDRCDVILTTGGISMGETDIVEQVLVQHCGGTLQFGRMHMKPGKPTTFVTISSSSSSNSSPNKKKDDDDDHGRATRLVFAMPGNPVSATVCTQLLVKPCLDLLFHGMDEDFEFEEDASALLVVVSDNNNPETKKLEHMVDNALLHPEIVATLSHDVTLDAFRPEYHRVTLEKVQVLRSEDGVSSSDNYNYNYNYEASTTGVQRSSRLASCRDAQGLLVLPVGGPSKPKALKGERYTVLLLGDLRGIDRVRLKDSLHLNQKKKNAREFKVAVVEVLPKDRQDLSVLDATCDQVKDALSGSKSGSVSIVSKKVFTGDVKDLYSFAIDSKGADFIVVSCVTLEGSFSYNLDVASSLRGRLQKCADALALQARQGAASQDPIAALFEVVVGYAPEKQGAMMIFLPDRGVTGGLGNVRGLLKHALNVARGKPHTHHHTHKHHDHAKQTKS